MNEFTSRDEELLSRFLLLAQDYSHEEQLQAAIRLLMHQTDNPFHPVDARRKRNLLFEGVTSASVVRRDRRFTREEALLLAVGFLQGLIREDQGPEGMRPPSAALPY